MRNADYLSALGEQLFVFVEQQFAFVVHRYHAQRYAFARCLKLPRHDVGMMLHDGHDNLVALAHKPVAERRNHKVKALGGSAREDYFVNRTCIDKLAHLFACLFVQVGCLLRKIMHAAVYVCIDIEILFAHGIEHAQRFLRCCTVVEIYQRTVVNLTAEYREVFSYFGYVEHTFLGVKVVKGVRVVKVNSLNNFIQSNVAKD